MGSSPITSILLLRGVGAQQLAQRAAEDAVMTCCVHPRARGASQNHAARATGKAGAAIGLFWEKTRGWRAGFAAASRNTS